MGVFLIIAVRNLIQARRRTAFLSAALVVVTALLVLLVALSAGIQENLIRSATTLSSGHVNVGGFYKVGSGDVSPIVTRIDVLREDVRGLSPEVDYLIDRHRGWAKLVSETGSMYAGLNGVDIQAEERLVSTLRLAPEADYRPGGGAEARGDLKGLTAPRTAIVFASQAKRLGVGVGDVITLRTETMRGQSNTADVTVVAVARDLGLLSTFTIFVPKETIIDLYQLRPDTSGAVQIYLKDIDDAERVMGELRQGLASKGYAVMDHQPVPFWAKLESVQGEDWTGQRLDVTTWQDEVSFLTWIITAFDTITFILVGILVTIIAIGIMNTMWMSVRERTAEIGTLRAIGMSRGRVLLIFMLEATVLGAAASLVGGLLGAALAAGLSALELSIPVEAVRVVLLSDTLTLAVHPGSVARAVGTLTAFTMLSALWPAIRAARLQPVTAMQHVE